MILRLLLFSFIGAFIGFLTNRLAIFMLFHPHNKTLGFQGLIPARKNLIAKSIAEIVDKELIKTDEIVGTLVAVRDRIKNTYPGKLYEGLAWYKHLIPGLKGIIEDFVVEIADSIDVLKSLTKLRKEVDFEELIRLKIESFDFNTIEYLIYQVAIDEIKMIIIWGGIIGFFIGFVQFFVFHVLN